MKFAPRLGGAVFLLVVGLILWLAIPNLTDAVPLGTIGMILTIVGGIWVILEVLLSFSSGRNTTTERSQTVGRDGKVAESVHEVETR